MLTAREQDVDAFYAASAWKRGQRVALIGEPERVGVLVGRVAHLWVDRDAKPPMVRWDGKVDAAEVPWHHLETSTKGWT